MTITLDKNQVVVIMPKSRQGAKLSMDKFREILRLHELGYSQCEIARSCQIARATVQDYLRRARANHLTYEALENLSQTEIRDRLGKGKAPVPSPLTDEQCAQITQALSRKGVTLALLWEEGLDQSSWQCSYSSFCRHYQHWRGKQQMSLRQVYQGGDKLFVDYCGPTMPVQSESGAEIVQAQIFVACLGASNYIYAEATASQSLVDWLGSHQRTFEFLGGVPACIVPDNLKAGVTSACRYEPGVNRSYQSLAEHYGVVVLPARPNKPRDKAKVEKAVQEVERQILAPLRHQTFTSFHQLNQAIRTQLTQLNQRWMRDYQQTRQTRFEQVDQPALKPLPLNPFEFATWKQAKVGLDYHLEFEHHYYSVPYPYIRATVQIKVTDHLVEIFQEGERIALHERSRVRHRHSTNPDHLPPQHWAYKQQSKASFLAWATQVGPETLQQVEALFTQRPYEEQAFRSLRGLQALATRYGNDRLEAACYRANALGMVGMRRLKSILTHQLETTPLPETNAHTHSQPHDNLRGADYFA
jgi:transposase